MQIMLYGFSVIIHFLFKWIYLNIAMDRLKCLMEFWDARKFIRSISQCVAIFLSIGFLLNTMIDLGNIINVSMAFAFK